MHILSSWILLNLSRSDKIKSGTAQHFHTFRVGLILFSVFFYQHGGISRYTFLATGKA